MGANISEPEVQALTIPVIGISTQAGQHFSAQAGGSIVLWAPQPAAWDPAVAVLWVMAVTTAGVAAFWAGNDYLEGRQLLMDGTPAHGRRSISAIQATKVSRSACLPRLQNAVH